MFGRKYFLFPVMLVPVIVLSCNTAYQAQSVQYRDYRINGMGRSDSSIAQLIRPYGDSVWRSMSAVIAESETELPKQQPEGPLNNLLTDAMVAMAQQNYKVPVDAAFLNYGGIRLPALPAGKITRGKIFELSPFDNILVLLQLKGDVFQSFLDHMAAKGGWPCSGVHWQISADKKARNVRVGTAPLDPAKTYTIATVDYVANGGDDCTMLRSIPQINNGYLFRDAIIEYFSQLNHEGKKLAAKTENRVTHAE